MRQITSVALMLVILLAAASAAQAHHGYAAFYTTKEVTLKGTVTEWHWVHPHAILMFDVKDDKGTVVHWATEFGGKSFARDTFKPGSEVTVTLQPAKNGSPVGRTMQVVLADGQVLVAQRGAVTESPTENPNDKR